MSKAPTKDAAPPATPKPKRRAKLLLLAVPVVVLLAVAGGWFSGVLPRALGLGHAAKPPPAAPADTASAAPRPPVLVELPVIVSNLNGSGKRPVFLKLAAKLEVGKPEDAVLIAAQLPRLLDLFQTYLRETRPEELQGAVGTWRLRQELVARANIAVAPAHVGDILFTEMIVQ